jgi:hypothetical protein
MIIVFDEIGKVVQSMRNGGSFLPYVDNDSNLSPYYMYGHRMEIASRLTEKTKGVNKNKRYPLIALKMDTAEKARGDERDFNLNIVIATLSDVKSTADHRMTNTFRPVLYPLYELFLKQFRNSGLFFWEGDLSYPQHTKIDRPFWGTEAKEGNLKNIFDDPIDAIELVDLQFSMKKKGC